MKELILNNHIMILEKNKMLKPGKFIDQVNVTEIKMLTWKQPFGFLMLAGKDYETRIWDTHYRGWVLLHASKTGYKPMQLLNICGEHQFQRLTKKIEGFESKIYRSQGKAFAIGRIYGSFPFHDKKFEDKAFVQMYHDLFCHEYIDIHPIKPIAIKGKQGWAKVPQEIINEITIVENFMEG